MNNAAPYTEIDGIKCYNPEVAEGYADYPDEGFDVTQEMEENSFWCQSRNRMLRGVIKRYARHVGKTSFLDIGCATGGFITKLVADKNIVATGSEVYLKGLHYAQKNAPDAEFVQFDVTKNNMDRTFDIIGAFDVIEHIEEENAAVATIYQMLNAEGYFIVTVPQYMFLWSKLDELVHHKRRYSRTQLRAVLERHGFTIRFASSFVFLLFPLMLASRLLDKLQDNGNTSADAKNDIRKRVEIPKGLNWLFDKLMRVDEALIKVGIPLPFGGSLLAVAQKTSPKA